MMEFRSILACLEKAQKTIVLITQIDFFDWVSASEHASENAAGCGCHSGLTPSSLKIRCVTTKQHGPRPAYTQSLMTAFKPVTLRGSHVTLEPLSQRHHDALVEAVHDGKLWELWYTFIPKPEEMRSEIERRLRLQSEGTSLPFAVIGKGTAKAAGLTSYLNIDAANRRVEIGSTWYGASVQRTPINTECKFLLLTHAFESLNCIAVEFRTHFFNQQSRRAIERLGAKLDGVLRNHWVMPNGTLRDTCVYSIIAAEWPTVKAHLCSLLKS
jgi:RimJ/RimL family protein N-acetyltransferase